MAGKNVVEVCGPSYHLDDKKAAVQRAVNTFPQKLFGNDWMMASAPGEVQIAALGAEGRGSRNVEGRWFVVAGNTLYEMTAAGASTNLGTLNTYSGIVGMAHNATQLVIVDGPNLYVMSLATNVLALVSSEGWRGSDDVRELDGYMIFVDPETEQFYLSAIDDATTLDALDFSSADSSPDNIIAHVVSHRQILFLGTRSGEFWIDNGSAAFPFVRYQSYTMDVGIVGKHAAIVAADTVFWIGQTDRGTGLVYMLTGNQPQRVSTLAVEEALKSSTDISAATMWAYQTDGHEFVGINAPGLETTWVYDAALQQWHERGEWSAGWQPLRSRFVTAFDGEHYAIDSAGVVTRLDTSVNTLNTRVMRRERTWPHFIADDMEPRNFNELQLAMPTGSGGNVALEISNDGGSFFGPALLRPLGATGRRMQPLRWFDLGEAVNRVFRVWCTDDVPWAIHSATVDIS